MEQWRNYRILIGILLLGFSTSCEKSEIDDIDDIIQNMNLQPNQVDLDQISISSDLSNGVTMNLT